ncbi:hypothetical protein B1218_15440, partial [Pseudomonas ogarae]
WLAVLLLAVSASTMAATRGGNLAPSLPEIVGDPGSADLGDPGHRNHGPPRRTPGPSNAARDDVRPDTPVARELAPARLRSSRKTRQCSLPGNMQRPATQASGSKPPRHRG